MTAVPLLAFLDRHRWLLAVAITVVLLADIATLTRQTTTAVSVDEAVQRFREEPPEPDAAPSTSTPPVAPSVTATIPAPYTVSTRSVASPAPKGSPPSSPPAGPPAARSLGILKPRPGVYRYRTTGSESVSLFGASRTYPTETTRILRHGPGCAWTMQLILVEEHQEKHTACGTNTTLDVTASDTVVKWFGQSFRVQLACDPPIRHADRSRTAGPLGNFTCREPDGSSTFRGTTSLLGEETVMVGQQARRAWRRRLEGTFTGRTRGLVTTTELIDVETGTVLLEQRTNDIRQSAVVEVDYHQELTLVLLSLLPTA